jgi:FixJ family two-component response regulator
MSLAVVDDDAQIRRALGRLLRSHGHEVEEFDSAEAYLARTPAADCAIVDIELPGISGIELEERMRREGRAMAVVFITAHDDQALLSAVQRTHRTLLRKPLEERDLLDAIERATEF